MIKASGKGLYRLDGTVCKFPPEMSEMIKWTKAKEFSYAKHQKDIFDDIADKTIVKSFDDRKKPLKRKKSLDDTPKPSRQKADNYSDMQLKTHWKALMKFNAHRWDPKCSRPSCVKEISAEIDKVHYVARSDINKEAIYFLVSDNIIPDEPPQYIFDETFLQSMEINKEISIPQKSRVRLDATVRRFLGKTMTHIIPYGLKDGEYVYHRKQKMDIGTKLFRKSGLISI